MPRCSDPAIRQRLTGPDAEEDPVSTFDASILSPLHKLPRPDEGIRYILIDALDEALARSRGTTIVDLLTTTRVRLLPDWLRIVATARHEPEVLGRLRGLQALRVSVDDSANQEDVRQYLVYRLNTAALEGSVRSSGKSLTALHESLLAASDGNFLS